MLWMLRLVKYCSEQSAFSKNFMHIFTFTECFYFVARVVILYLNGIQTSEKLISSCRSDILHVCVCLVPPLSSPMKNISYI